MPAPPKSKSDKSATGPVTTWNKGTYRNGEYVIGVITLNYQVEGADGKPEAVTFPIQPGLCEVPRHHWERANADADRKKGAKHTLVKRRESGQLLPVDLRAMSTEDAKKALDQTTEKTLIKAVAEGRRDVSDAVQEYAAEVIKTWGSGEASKERRITRHFSSYLSRVA